MFGSVLLFFSYFSNKLYSDSLIMEKDMKKTTSTGGSLIFKYNATRCSIIAFVTRNGHNPSLYYIGIAGSGIYNTNKLAGDTTNFVINTSDKTITISVPEWSSVTLIGTF